MVCLAAPTEQFTNVHLVPVVVLDSIHKCPQFVLIQLHTAVLLLQHRVCAVTHTISLYSNVQPYITHARTHTHTVSLTFEPNLQTTKFQLHPLQSLPHSLVIVSNFFLTPSAEWEREVGIRLLSVVVRADCVYPHHYLFTLMILQRSIRTLHILNCRAALRLLIH